MNNFRQLLFIYHLSDVNHNVRFLTYLIK